MSGRLHALSPLATVQRGYAIARRYPEGEILRRAADTQMGDAIEILLGEGRLRAEIKAVGAIDSLLDASANH